jgi:hypothetical protein
MKQYPNNYPGILITNKTESKIYRPKHQFIFQLKNKNTMMFEVLTAVKMSLLFFWVVAPRVLVGRYQRFGGTYCVHLQG